MFDLVYKYVALLNVLVLFSDDAIYVSVRLYFIWRSVMDVGIVGYI